MCHDRGVGEFGSSPTLSFFSCQRHLNSAVFCVILLCFVVFCLGGIALLVAFVGYLRGYEAGWQVGADAHDRYLEDRYQTACQLDRRREGGAQAAREDEEQARQDAWDADAVAFNAETIGWAKADAARALRQAE